MKFFLNGSWEDRDEVIEVINPFDGSVVDTVPKASAADVETALQAAEAARLPLLQEPPRRGRGHLRAAAAQLGAGERERGRRGLH